MRAPRTTAAAPATWRRRPRLLLALAILAGLGGAWAFWPRDPAANPAAPRVPAEDPRLTVATPYRNVRPDVAYVGDAACSRCHPEEARTYAQHSMGRSLAPIAAATATATVPERYDAAAGNPFQAANFTYLAERRGDRLFHKEIARDARHQEIYQLETEVHFAIGSATRGRSYLFARDGYLFVSPMTWYPQKQTWALSPGYEQGNQHFARSITAECLFCHSNHADRVADTQNHYRAPIFHGHAIGCERCHGPGQEHVERRRRQEPVDEVDYTIVNPRRLEPALREAVCEQCHLQGHYRILRRGRDDFDFRPGLPLHRFKSVFFKPPAPGTKSQTSFVGHVEQMHASRCFRGSNGQMGCVSCHDPHRLPAAEEKAAYYRDRCLSCHNQNGCSVPAAMRRMKEPDDSCMACHMPRTGSVVTHASITDHRVPRWADKTPEATGPVPASDPDLVYFHQDLASPQDEEVARDRALALIQMMAIEGRGPELARRALPMLETALRRDPEDLIAWDAKGLALQTTGRWAEAAAAFETVLAAAPRREVALRHAAELALATKQYDAAIAYWERAIQVSPWRWEYHYGLAEAHAQKGAWRPAVAAAEKALQLNPARLEVRDLLFMGYVKLGDKARARAAVEGLLGFNPPDAAELRRWAAENLR
jgi:Flp pilus assembly protein TadD